MTTTIDPEPTEQQPPPCTPGRWLLFSPGANRGRLVSGHPVVDGWSELSLREHGAGLGAEVPALRDPLGMSLTSTPAAKTKGQQARWVTPWSSGWVCCRAGAAHRAIASPWTLNGLVLAAIDIARDILATHAAARTELADATAGLIPLSGSRIDAIWAHHRATGEPARIAVETV